MVPAPLRRAPAHRYSLPQYGPHYNPGCAVCLPTHLGATEAPTRIHDSRSGQFP